MAERLQKVMAHAGVASRRESEKIIAAGRVSVNGERVTEPGTKVNPEDVIEVDGELIEKEERVYFIFHKPENVVTTVSDEFNRTTVMDFFDDIPQRIYPVGRLDFDTTGILIMTNDGNFANKLMHPRYEIKKTYLAQVAGQFTEEAKKKLEAGVEIDGEKTAPAEVNIVRRDRRNSVVELIIHEGRYHQVKKMFHRTGFPVEKLHRSQYGNIKLNNLKAGEWRELSVDEIQALL